MLNLPVWMRVGLLTPLLFVAACDGGSSGSDSSPGGSQPDPPAGPTSPDNNAPNISGAPATVAQVGQVYVFRPSASDPDGDVLSFHIANQPDWATFDTATGRLRGTPSSTAKPVYVGVQIAVTDSKTTSFLPAFDITIVAAPVVNTPPTLEGTPGTSVVAGNAYEFVPRAADVDAQTLVFSIGNKPQWAQFDSATGRLWGTPAEADVGVVRSIVIAVSDGTAETALPAFDISVTASPGPVVDPNSPPKISGVPASGVVAGQVYGFQPTASDPDGQLLRFAIANKPRWANFDQVTGRLSGTPDATEVGTYSGIAIAVSDGTASATLPVFTITVTAANRAPVISGTPATTVVTGQAYSFRPTAQDADGDTLTYSIQGKPAWASFDGVTGRLSGTPDATEVGTYSGIAIAVSDGTASATLPVFTITVTAANRAPVISGTPVTTAVTGQAYSFRPTATDADGDTLTYSIQGKPAWASFDGVTGRLSGTPDATEAGTYSGIAITVSDGTETAHAARVHDYGYGSESRTGHQRYAGDDRGDGTGIFVQADGLRSGRPVIEVRHRKQASMGRLR